MKVTEITTKSHRETNVGFNSHFLEWWNKKRNHNHVREILVF